MSGPRYRNAEDEAAAKKREEESRYAAEVAKREAEQRKADLCAVMRTPAGRRTMWRLLNDCHVMSTIFSPEPTRMAMLEGQRSVGVALTAELQSTCRNEYLVMLQEAVAALPPVVS